MEERWTFIRRIMTNLSKKVLFDMKPQLKLLLSKNVKATGKLLDPKIAAWLINTEENKEKNIHQLVEDYLNLKRTSIPLTQFESACLRANRSLLLSAKLMEILEADPTQIKLYMTLEMPLVPILAQMEAAGFGFLKEEGKELKRTIENKLAVLEKRAYEVANREFSLTNPAEIGMIIFDELKLPHLGQGRKGARGYSTAKKVLTQLADYHTLPGIVLEHRKLTNTLTKYLDSLFQYAFKDTNQNIDRIYTTISQTTVPTGRLAFADPNLQAIPHAFQFFPVEEEEKPSPERKALNVPIRDFFVSRPGYVLMSADYAQIELRFLAHFTGDQNLVASFKGGDVFMKIASQWLDKTVENVTKEEREKTKHLCYGIIYGMGAVAMSEKIGSTKEEAQHMIETFKEKYTGIKSFLRSVIEECSKTGLVQTILGRKRNVPGIFSPKNNERSAAERMAVNTVCQGSAADLIKKGMIAIDQKIANAGLDITLLVQIHDELIFEVKEDQAEIAQFMIKKSMEKALILSVPLPVKIQVGKSWGSMEEYKATPNKGQVK
eukprot:TRINITY_DN8063_c0_g2_i1.p1 TRINITY_DN8063_c0_g2~~TRINITY_DN8063_c0_g2_i1.p1  ORF type:complete len:548 (+),score=174.39 TRINITY_DN8063_c0_g2_i1:229-1872(+)